MDRLLNVLAVLSLAMIVAVLASVRRAHIRVEYSVSWLLAGVALLGLSRSAVALQWIARVTGSAEPATALLMTAGAIFLLVLFRLSLRISGLKDANIALTQRIAILEYRLETIDEKVKASPAR
jgi:hypothetical protein